MADDKVTIVPRNDIRDAALNAATAVAEVKAEIERVHKATTDQYDPYNTVLSVRELDAIQDIAREFSVLHEIVYGYGLSY